MYAGSVVGQDYLHQSANFFEYFTLLKFLIFVHSIRNINILANVRRYKLVQPTIILSEICSAGKYIATFLCFHQKLNGTNKCSRQLSFWNLFLPKIHTQRSCYFCFQQINWKKHHHFSQRTDTNEMQFFWSCRIVVACGVPSFYQSSINFCGSVQNLRQTFWYLKI